MTPNPLCVNPFFGHPIHSLLYVRCVLEEAHHRYWWLVLVASQNATAHTATHHLRDEPRTSYTNRTETPTFYEDIRTEKFHHKIVQNSNLPEYNGCYDDAAAHFLGISPFSLFCCLSLIYGRSYSHSPKLIVCGTMYYYRVVFSLQLVCRQTHTHKHTLVVAHIHKNEIETAATTEHAISFLLALSYSFHCTMASVVSGRMLFVCFTWLKYFCVCVVELK